MFKITLSYSCALMWNNISVEIRNAHIIDAFVNKCLTWMIDAFVDKCLTWMKDVKF